VKGWLARFGRGLALGLRGMLGKELRTRSRGWRPMWLITVYLGLVTIGVSLFLAIAGTGSGSGLGFALGLAAGKLVAGWLTVVFLLLASLPAFALVYLFGGVPPKLLAVIVLLANATALAHCSLGLLCSALLKRTVVASVVSYLVVLFILGGIPFIGLIANAFALASIATNALAAGAPETETPREVFLLPLGYLVNFVNPIVVMVALATNSFGVSQSAFGDVPLRQVYYLAQERGTPVDPVISWAPWVYYVGLSIIFSLASLVLVALVLAPVKPWHTWRAKRRLARASL
jgi:hypothetical protein